MSTMLSFLCCTKSNRAIAASHSDTKDAPAENKQDNLQNIDALLKHLHDVKPATVDEISLLRQSLFKEGWMNLSSKDMVSVLKHFGATTNDLCKVADPSTSPHGNLWFHETLLPWKKTQASRFILRKKQREMNEKTNEKDGDEDGNFEGCDSKSVVRYEVNKEQVDFGEYWKDANSEVRTWKPLPDWYGSEKNSVYMAYQKFSHFLIEPTLEPAPGSVAGSDIHVSDHFCIRITKTPQDGEMAQPSPEGVHHDGSDIIMITLMNRRNVTEESGQTRVWHKDQPSGPYPEDSFDGTKDKCLANFVMKQPYETLLAIDSRVKHEARAIKPTIPDMDCTRDVTVHWTRTPRSSGCDTIGGDSQARHWLSSSTSTAQQGRKPLFKIDDNFNFWKKKIDDFFMQSKE